MAQQKRAKILGPFQPRWINFTGLALLGLSGVALLVPRRSR